VLNNHGRERIGRVRYEQREQPLALNVGSCHRHDRPVHCKTAQNARPESTDQPRVENVAVPQWRGDAEFPAGMTDPDQRMDVGEVAQAADPIAGYPTDR
jgi:hypothetical protein